MQNNISADIMNTVILESREMVIVIFVQQVIPGDREGNRSAACSPAATYTGIQ